MTNQQPPRRQLILLLNYLITSYLLDACIYELKDTSVFRQKLKKSLNDVWREIQPVIDRDLKLLDGTDDAAMWNMMEGMRDLMAELADMRPENLVGLMHLVRQYKGDPEAFLSKNDIVILEPQELVACNERGEEVARCA
jgi:uncharacterized protein YjgD (DUF1641 family)